MTVEDYLSVPEISGPMSPGEYVRSEVKSHVKRDYINGYARKRHDERIDHHRIAGNTRYCLSRQVGPRSFVWGSDTKVRIRSPGHYRFYYPDLMVTCESVPGNRHYLDVPALIAEVISRRTRSIDENEKLAAYQRIDSLSVYLLIDQEAPRVTAWRRSPSGIHREVYGDLNAVVPLFEVGAELPLAEVYDRCEFTPEKDGACYDPS